MKTAEVKDKAQITLDEEGILSMTMAPKSSITDIDAEEICRVAAEISGDTIHCNLVDISQMTFMDKKARSVFSGQKKSTVNAVAIVNNSRFQRSLVNLYFSFSKPIIPTKAFSEANEARTWLLSKL